jgi:hypothetical protein
MSTGHGNIMHLSTSAGESTEVADAKGGMAFISFKESMAVTSGCWSRSSGF